MENSEWKYSVFRNGQFSSGIYPISCFLFWQSFWTSRWRRGAGEMAKYNSPLTPPPKLNGRQKDLETLKQKTT